MKKKSWLLSSLQSNHYFTQIPTIRQIHAIHRSVISLTEDHSLLSLSVSVFPFLRCSFSSFCRKMGGAGPANFAGKLLNKLTAPQREGWGGLREERAEPAASSSSPTTPTTGQDSNLAGNLTTLGNSFIAFVGAGILDLPYAFSKVGLRLGSFVMLAVSLVCLHCMYMLIDCKIFLEKNGKKCSTYGEVGKEALGPAGGILVNIALSITQFGFCTAYFILISHNLDAILTDSPGYIPYIWLCVPGQMMLATLRHLKFLGKFSLIADVTMAFALGSVFYYCRNQLISQKDADMQRLQSDFSNAPYFFGVCIYCYEGIGMVIPIQAAMKNKHQFKLVWGHQHGVGDSVVLVGRLCRLLCIWCECA